MFYVILAILLIVADQAVKFAVRANIDLGQSIPFIPHVLALTNIRNTGAAFSILSRHTWLLTLTSVVVVLVICWLIVKGFFQNALGRWAAALVLAGGMGNLIDRVVFGAVTDMFQTTFIDFPIFNVADSCITVGVPLLFLYVLLYVGKEKPADSADAEKSTDSAEQKESSDSEGKKNSAGRWIAIGAAGGFALSLCVWGVARARTKKKEAQRGKGAKKRKPRKRSGWPG